MRRNEPQGVNSYLKTNVCVYIISVFMKLPFNGCSFFGCFHIWPSNTSNTNCLDFSMQLELQTYNSFYSLGSRLLELPVSKNLSICFIHLSFESFASDITRKVTNKHCTSFFFRVMLALFFIFFYNFEFQTRPRKC